MRFHVTVDVRDPTDHLATNMTCGRFGLFLDYDNKQQIQAIISMEECTEILDWPANSEPPTAFKFLLLVPLVPVPVETVDPERRSAGITQENLEDEVVGGLWRDEMQDGK